MLPRKESASVKHGAISQSNGTGRKDRTSLASTYCDNDEDNSLANTTRPLIHKHIHLQGKKRARRVFLTLDLWLSMTRRLLMKSELSDTWQLTHTFKANTVWNLSITVFLDAGLAAGRNHVPPWHPSRDIALVQDAPHSLRGPRGRDPCADFCGYNRLAEHGSRTYGSVVGKQTRKGNLEPKLRRTSLALIHY